MIIPQLEKKIEKEKGNKRMVDRQATSYDAFVS